jgi:spore maturation protein CgeB
MFFIAGYDYLFFKDKYVVNKLKNEYNLNAFYLPQCCNPSKHKIVTITEKDKALYGCEITNAGNLYPSRAALYRQLTKYSFKMWGAPPAVWLNVPELSSIIMGKSVHNEEKSKAFQSAKIVLNNMHLAEIEGVHKRTFEIPACGGFQIITHNDAVSELFEIGKEIVTYKNLDDLKTKINYYLDPENEKERKAIIKAGYERAVKDHTYKNRLETIIKTALNE